MEDPNVMPTINNTPVIGSIARRAGDVESRLRKVYIGYVRSGVESLVFGLFICLVGYFIIRKQVTPGRGAAVIFLEAIFMAIAMFGLLEIVVNSYFVYLLYSGREDMVGWRRRKTLVRLLLGVDCRRYRTLKGIERERDGEATVGQTANPNLITISTTAAVKINNTTAAATPHDAI